MKPKTYGGYTTIQAPETFCQWKTSMHVDEIKLLYYQAMNRYYCHQRYSDEHWTVNRHHYDDEKTFHDDYQESEMDTIIDMNRISWNIKARHWVLIHMAMICQGLQIHLPDTITGHAILDGSKIEWAVDERILVKHMNVLLGDYQVIRNSIRSRWARRLDQMTLMSLIWMK